MTIKYYTSTKETLMEMGIRIKRLRLTNGLTQAELAKRSGVSAGTISNLESGKDVSFSNFISLLRALNALQELDAVMHPYSFAVDINERTGKEKQRVREKKTKRNSPWKWGDEQ